MEMVFYLGCRSSVLLKYCYPKKSLQFSKRYSLYPLLKRKPPLLKKTDFKLIYDFPFIRLPVGVIKSGTTNILLSIVSSPFIYSYYGSITPCFIVLGGATIHLIMVIGFSQLLRNIVGKIYVNKEGEVKDVIISSVDKFGRRIDRIHNANELLNCEYHTKVTGQLGFIQISVENSDIHYKVNIRNCKIYDLIIWENLFGRVPFPNFNRKNNNKAVEIKKIE